MFFILYLSTCLTLYFHCSYYWLFVKLSDVCSAKCCQGTVALAEFLFFQHWLLWFSAHHCFEASGIGFHCFQETLGAAGVIGTLGCRMNEQLLGSETTHLTKCDGHQFVSVEPTCEQPVCSCPAGSTCSKMNHEEPHGTCAHEYAHGKIWRAEITYPEERAQLDVRRYPVRCVYV